MDLRLAFFFAIVSGTAALVFPWRPAAAAPVSAAAPPARLLPASARSGRLLDVRAAAAGLRRTGDVRMGVPKFFRWLTEKYPQINVRISEGRRRNDYVDNFYLDMNGIIHTCTHGDEISPNLNLTEEQMVERIFEYTERLINIANPRKVLYLAIDGVAPRAKMNQQRSRRYRVPREMQQQALRDKANDKASQFKKEGEVVAAGGAPMHDTFGGSPKAPPFDSNCITPGTDFLYRLGRKYEEWIAHKMSTDPKWQNGPTVVFSGADVPGEGEHKIMDFIREGRAKSNHRSETRHCMYGLDADLIMLGMITHEEHFYLLRERQKFQKGRFAPRGRGKAGNRGGSGGGGGGGGGFRGGSGRGAASAPLRSSPRLQLSAEGGAKGGGEAQPDYASTFAPDWAAAERADADRAADDADFVFLELEMLRQCLAGSMRPLLPAASLPFQWTQERAVDDFVFLCMLVGNDFLPGLPSLDVADGALDRMMRIYTDLMPSLGGYLTHKGELDFGRFEAFIGELAQGEGYVVRKKMGRDPDLVGPSESESESPTEYKRRYYLQKVGIHPNDKAGRRALTTSYLEGLVWCLEYYHNGCRSWDWYFPDFYAPLASDLVDLPSYEIKLATGSPFPPLAQLLSVLPPQSGALLPPSYASLMLSPVSPIFDAFPIDFNLDANGKRAEWESVALLPFIDETRLLAAVAAIDPAQLTPQERERNHRRTDLVFAPGEAVGVRAPPSKPVAAALAAAAR